MIFDLSSFLNGDEIVLNIEGELENKDIAKDLGSESNIIGPIKFKGKIFKVNVERLIHLNIFYKYESKCDRCLQPTTKEIKTSLEAKLEDFNGKYNDEDEDLDEIIYLDNGLLDLEDYIYSQVISSLPMKSLCDKECKGLCPKCGVNLNTESCDCTHEEIDPRLEKLKDFFKN